MNNNGNLSQEDRQYQINLLEEKLKDSDWFRPFLKYLAGNWKKNGNEKIR